MTFLASSLLFIVPQIWHECPVRGAGIAENSAAHDTMMLGLSPEQRKECHRCATRSAMTTAWLSCGPLNFNIHQFKFLSFFVVAKPVPINLLLLLQ
jgi:hypothetical protein